MHGSTTRCGWIAAALDALPLTALAAEYRRIEAELLERWDAPLIKRLSLHDGVRLLAQADRALGGTGRA